MEIRKILLYVALAFVGMALWNNWTRFKHPSSVAPTHLQQGATPQAAGSSSAAGSGQSTTGAYAVPSTAPQGGASSVAMGDKGQWIHVQSDLMRVAIDPVGGSVVSVELLKYGQQLGAGSPRVAILSPVDKNLALMQMGFAGKSGKVLPPIHFKSIQQHYVMRKGQASLSVDLQGTSKDGLKVTRHYVFKRGSYAIDIKDQLKNSGSSAWEGNSFAQFLHRSAKSHHAFSSRTFTGAALSSEHTPYKKISYKSLKENNLSRSIQGGWLALQKKYFLSALVPNHVSMNHYYSQMNPAGGGDQSILTLGVASPVMNLSAGQSSSQTLKIYTGPELASQLDAVAPHLSLTVDYGWLWWLSKPIFWVLQKIHHVIGNWGWSIILITLLIKLLLHPFTAMSFRSMAKMRELAPQMKALKERHGDDKQKLSMATMELYRREKINPLGGCLPMLLQIPFFIALYYVLIESVQLRQAPFIFWIHDLAAKDPYFVLPVLMGLSMFFQQKLSPAPPDPMQAKMMMLLPVFLTVMFLKFPAGLVLYWLSNNIITIIQQWWVNRQVAMQKKRRH